MEHTESITIDRPASEIWPLIGDPRRWTTWIKDVSDFELDTDELGEGSELVYKYRGRPARATVERYEEGKAIEIGAIEKSWNFEESITLTPQGDRTEVTFTMGFDPTAGWAKAMATLLSPFKGPLLAKPLKRELQALKSEVEGS